MRSDVTIGATLASSEGNTKGIRVDSSDRSSIRRDDCGTCDVDEDVSVVRGAKEASEVRTPIRGIGTMTLVGTTRIMGHKLSMSCTEY